jgi:hypothetical protein
LLQKYWLDGTLTTVNVEDDAIASLQSSGLLAVLIWAAPVAFARTGNDYDEDAGHDQLIIGVHNFVYIRDLLDRATGNGRFALAADAANLGYDFIERGISTEALASMPTLNSFPIVRSDYQNSPGWAADGYRVLLQSYKFGGVDRINWGQKSDAKKRVADQRFLAGPTLFNDEDYGLESLAGVPGDDEFDGVTLVAAHSYDPITGRFELHIGQSKNREFRSDTCWHWRRLLLGGGTSGGSQSSLAPQLAASNGGADGSADVPVRLRSARSGERSAAGHE